MTQLITFKKGSKVDRVLLHPEFCQQDELHVIKYINSDSNKAGCQTIHCTWRLSASRISALMLKSELVMLVRPVRSVLMSLFVAASALCTLPARTTRPCQWNEVIISTKKFLPWSILYLCPNSLGLPKKLVIYYYYVAWIPPPDLHLTKE